MAYDYDFQFINSVKAVEDGINFIKRLKNKVFFNVNSEDSSKLEFQWANYEMKNDKVVKRDDHIIDAIRYALYTAYKFFPEYFEQLLTDSTIDSVLKEAI